MSHQYDQTEPEPSVENIETLPNKTESSSSRPIATEIGFYLTPPQTHQKTKKELPASVCVISS